MHRRTNRDTNHVRLFVFYRREHKLSADVCIYIDVLVVWSLQQVVRHPGTVNIQVALDRIKLDARRVIRSGDVFHHFSERVQRLLGLDDVVELRPAHDLLGLFDLRNMMFEVDVGVGLEHLLELPLFSRGRTHSCLFSQPLEAVLDTPLNEHEEPTGENVVVHLNIDIFLHHGDPVLPEDGGDAWERQIRGGGDPFRGK